MKLAFYSPSFYPRIGGLENVVRDLAEACTSLGHEVLVITQTPGAVDEPFSFPVLRCASLIAQIRAMRKSDIVVQFNVSLKGIPPWALSSRPLAVSHQTQNMPDWRGRLKRIVANHLATTNIGCSRFISSAFRSAATIPNPYDHQLFRTTTPWEDREPALIFVGRLVSDKGVRLLLKALARLKDDGIAVPLTLVGDGPEKASLRKQIEEDSLAGQVRFAGVQTGEALVALINRHQIMVIPSLWEEPFGIVALEGLACGCVVLASDGGGLPEALGGLGPSFPNGNVTALTQQLRSLLQNPETYRPEAAAVKQHLDRCQKINVAREYLALFEKSLARTT